MTAFNVIKSLTKRGNVVIGSGCYAAAIDSTDRTQVIKIGNSMSDPWLDYYHLVIKKNQDNPHIPKVKYFMCDEEHSYYICIMERLDEDSCNTTPKYKTKITELCKDYTSCIITYAEFVTQCAAYAEAIPDVAKLAELLELIRKHTEVFIGDFDEQGECAIKLDMHKGNFLFRDYTLVVTDPWCENDMSDLVDVSEWVERMSDKVATQSR
jgi:hypothetical protein